MNYTAEQLAEVAQQLRAADDTLSEAISKHPGELTAHLARARFRTETALQLAKARIAAAVESAAGVGFAQGSISDYARVASLQHTLDEEQRESVLAEVHVNTGTMCMQLERFDDACRAATEALAVVHERSSDLERKTAHAAHKTRGTALHLLGDVPSALVDYDAAVLVAPQDGELLYNRGEALMTLGRFADAIRDLDAAHDLGQTHVLLHVNRAIAHEALGSTDQAHADYERALALDAGNAQARAGLSRTS